MFSIPSSSKKSYSADVKSVKSSHEGKFYEELVLLLLAERYCELSEDVKSKLSNFSIGRGVDLREKIADTVFRYKDKDNKNNLIFVQIKNKQDYYQIDSQILSAETSSSENYDLDGGMRKDFNLQKYFISYIRVRDELNNTKSKELENGKVKYIALFANIGLDIEELNDKGFSLKKSPYDIINLFSLRKSSQTTDNSDHCYQLNDVSDGLREILMKSSDLHRLARELAQYVVWKEYRENKIMGIDDTLIKYYHVALGKSVIRKLGKVQNENSEKHMKNERYCEAQLRDDFVDSEENGSRLQLRDALFEAIRQLDETKKTVDDDELKRILKKTKWKVVPNFGKSKQNNKTDLPCEWIKVNEEDIADFLKCLVIIVNQPRMKELEAIFKSSSDDTFVESTSFRAILHKIENTDTEFWKQMEEVLKIDLKAKYKENWISCENIVNFIEEQKQLISISFIVAEVTLKYEYDLKKYGEFNQFGKLGESLDAFLLSNSKILRVNSTCTVFSSIKILQYLNKKKDYTAKNGRISTNLDILGSKENRESIIKAFGLITNCLLFIEYRYTFMKHNMEEFLNKLFNIVSGNPNKKIIFIIQQGEPIILPGKYQTDFPNENSFVLEKDSIELKDFEPVEDPIKKEMLLFQGQDKRVSFASLTGIDCWNSYIEDLSQKTFGGKRKIIDEKSLIEILDDEEIEIGSKPLGTSSLEGAYAILFEEISIETLATTLLYLGSNNNSHSLEDPSARIDNNDDIYIISGIKGSSKKEKIDKLIQYLDLVNQQEKILSLFAEIDSDSKIQIADDELKHEDFKRICFNKPEKRIFWIDTKYDENGLKFILRQLYNPNFYLKRNFKQIIAMKEIKEQLMEKCLSEIFIFCCVENERVLMDSLKFSNGTEAKRFKKHCKTGEIMLFTEEADAKAKFYELCKHNKVIHFLKVINKDLNEILFIKEHDLIKEIKDRKVVVIAGEAGMGKTSTLTKLYENKNEHESFIETHWVIRINLKYHMHAIRDIKSVNAISVVNFLSNSDLKLNHNLAKTLLAVALDKEVKFLKPLLLAFDGFDEILDEDARNKIISILTFLKYHSAANLWITTSLRYKKTLENVLSTFALEFDPMDDDFKVAYIKQYLEDRLCLSEKKTAELFVQDNEKQVNVQMYAAEFLERMKSVFTGNISRFIGISLQLYLVLDGSARHFKEWMEKGEVESLTFNYLDDDVCEVYEKFVDSRYQVFFQMEGIRESAQQRYQTVNLEKISTNLAMSLILEKQIPSYFEEFKDINNTIFSVGIFKSYHNSVDFIHTTFRDYFAAKVFVQWMTKIPDVVLSASNKDILFKVILREPDYALIRCFINAKLKSVMETNVFEEPLKHFGMIIEKMLREEESFSIDLKGTVLHIAVNEGNKNIVCFLLKSLKGHTDALKKFLFAPDKDERTALHILAADSSYDDKILELLLAAEEELLKDTSKNTNVQRNCVITKKVIVFEGQKEKVCLARLTGITSWKYIIDYLVGEVFFTKQDIADLITLILNNDSVEIGSQPLGTSSLNGAYGALFEEISIETLANKFLYLGSDNKRSLLDPSVGIDNNNDIYIISGIKGSSKKEKIDNLIQYLDLVNEQEKIENLFGDIGSECKIQIGDDQIKDEDFKRICFNKPEKRIFWIDIKYDKNGLKFILRQVYNPKFYLKRNFKQVTDMKEAKKQLMEKCISETFIFCCVEDEQVLINSLKFSNENEKERFKNHCKTSEIKFFTEEADAKAKFYELCKHNKVIHFFKVINKELNEILFIKEHNLIDEIKDKNVVIIAGEPGMGKTSTLTKLYETKNEHESFIETHWVIRINLNNHMQAIREINIVNGNTDTVSVVNVLSSVDAKLNNNLAKTLLAVALDKKVKFLKPLLLAFDGFDEILDEDVRNNIIIIFKFLKEQSAAKLWIITSLRYQKTLENELSTFALEFDPMDDDFKEAYVRQYLEDRLCLSEKKITELFVQDNERQENVQMYTAHLLDRMKSIFAGNISRLIGTPLQLYLMLDGSARHFKEWIEKEEVENLTFNHLGDDLWEVYEKFIDRKYDLYFRKKGIRECLRLKANKFIIDQYNEGLAMALILGVEPKNSLEEFKDIVLFFGIIESHGNNIQFIHTTFRDYFAAKVFVQWIKKRPSVFSNSFKKEYILKEILRKPDYPFIRFFINTKLKNVMETKRFEECLKHYGMVIEKLLKKEESSLIDEKGTALHAAVAEGNINIASFLLNSLKGHTDILKKFLSTPDKDKRTPLNLAQSRGDDEIVKLLSDAEAELYEVIGDSINVQRKEISS